MCWASSVKRNLNMFQFTLLALVLNFELVAPLAYKYLGGEILRFLSPPTLTSHSSSPRYIAHSSYIPLHTYTHFFYTHTSKATPSTLLGSTRDLFLLIHWVRNLHHPYPVSLREHCSIFKIRIDREADLESKLEPEVNRDFDHRETRGHEPIQTRILDWKKKVRCLRCFCSSTSFETLEVIVYEFCII